MTPPSCIVCGGALNQWFERLGRSVHRCAACGHIQVPAGVYVLQDGGSIYEAEHADIFEGEGTADYYLTEESAQAAQRKLAFVRRFASQGSTLLDAGASYGHFVAAAQHDFRASGVEINPTAVEWSRANLGISSVRGSIYALPSDVTPDLITAWDVVEHLADPRAALQQCRDRLSRGGWLFLSTPDAGSLAARMMGSRWHYQDPVQHINLFSRQNLTRLLADHGFGVAGHTYFGRAYKVSYILHRVRYLMGEHPAARAVDVLQRLPGGILRRAVSIKLWDVLGLAARAE